MDKRMVKNNKHSIQKRLGSIKKHFLARESTIKTHFLQKRFKKIDYSLNERQNIYQMGISNSYKGKLSAFLLNKTNNSSYMPLDDVDSKRLRRNVLARKLNTNLIELLSKI